MTPRTMLRWLPEVGLRGLRVWGLGFRVCSVSFSTVFAASRVNTLRDRVVGRVHLLLHMFKPLQYGLGRGMFGCRAQGLFSLRGFVPPATS